MEMTDAKVVEFQSTHPLGVRQKALDKASNMTVFQSTHPLGVRPIEFATELAGGGFNPRTHSGCDFAWGSDGKCWVYVSIHAPTRGATRNSVSQQYGEVVSIHAPTRGATSVLE